MRASFRLDRSIPVLSVEGRLDARGAAAFDEIWRTLPPESTHVVLDLTAVDYLSSVGIGSLVLAEKSLRERHGRTFLAGLSPFVAKILETTGLLRELRHASSVPVAIQQAIIAKTARDASTEHTIQGYLYRISPKSTESCVLELWGNYQQVSDTPGSVFSILEDHSPQIPIPIGATLEELGFGFGEGGFGNAGSHSPDCMGVFIAGGRFAGVLPVGADSMSDFVISDRPDEVELLISRAIGFSGPSSFEIDVNAPVPAPLRGLLAHSAALLAGKTGSTSPVIGFVMQGVGAQCMLLVGVFSPDLEKLYGNAILYKATPTLTPEIEDLKAVSQIDPQSAFERASILVYLPRALRLGVEKRLKIQAEGDIPLEEEWIQIIRRLYRDDSRIILSQLPGGYMGKTFRVTGYDREGRRVLPTVLKISTNELIQREEEAHRTYVQKFILNNSTTIMGTATVGSWAALRYNFLGISGPDATLTWLRDYYQTRSTDAVLNLLHRLYTQILKPWYGQPRWEPICLFADHTPLRLFPNLCAHAERDFGFSSEGESIECAELGVSLPNPFLFLRTEYPKRSAWSQLWYQGINHGDLNLRNVLVDEKENLYVIDFSETRPRNIVADFARMETILKFEMTRVDTVEDLTRMIQFERGLAESDSLEDMPPNRYRGDDPLVEKAYSVICRLRHYANTVTLFETDIVPYWLALLEWTFSVLSYDLPPLRRKLAAYSAAILCGRIRARDVS
jgi:anti-anti-sigma factor